MANGAGRVVAEKIQTCTIICPGPSITDYGLKVRLLPRPWIAVNNVRGFDPDYHMWVNKRRYKDHGKHMKHGTPIFGYKFTEDIIKHRPYETVLFQNDYLTRKGSVKIAGETIIGSGMTGAIIAGAWAVIQGAETLIYAGVDGFSGERSHAYKEKRLSGMGKLLMLQDATFGCFRDLSKLAKVRIATPTVYETWYEGFANILR